MKEEFAYNLNTGRIIRKSTALYKRLAKLGQVADELPKQEPEQPKPTIEPKPVQPPIKKKLLEVATDIVAQNREQFTPELTQKETDRLLRRMLYDKLCLTPKKKKKKQHRPPSSSDSDSD